MPNITLENLKAALQSIRQLLGRKAEEPDWNQNDPKSPNYIRNRPFYSEIKPAKILNGTFDFTENYGVYATQLPTFDIVVGKSYTVIWDGVPYQIDGKDFSGDVLLGNLFMMTGDINDDTGEPFLFVRGNDSNLVGTLDASSKHSISIIADFEYNHTIDQKYLDTDFPVDLTMDKNGEWTSSKSQIEIDLAVRQGKRVYAKVWGNSKDAYELLPLVTAPLGGSQDFPAIFTGFIGGGRLGIGSFSITISYHHDQPVVYFTDMSDRLLPNISSSDNGKVLKVVDGKWTKVDPNTEVIA